jgi:hypothetical protein
VAEAARVLRKVSDVGLFRLSALADFPGGPARSLSPMTLEFLGDLAAEEIGIRSGLSMRGTAMPTYTTIEEAEAAIKLVMGVAAGEAGALDSDDELVAALRFIATTLIRWEKLKATEAHA